MLLKLRNDYNSEFTHYAEVPEDKLKRYVGPLSPNDEVSFKFSIPIIEELRPYFNHREENIYILKIPYNFYFIDGGHFVIYTHRETFFYHQEIIEFRIGDRNAFQSVDNIQYYTWSYFDEARKKFIPIGGVEMHFAITDEAEIVELNLQETQI